MYSFAERLKKARMKSGLSQVELDKRCDHKPGWIAQYEASNRDPNLKSIRTIMKVLKVDANYLLK